MDMASMVNWVDILAVIIMLRTIYMSFQDGLSREILPLFISIFKLVLALHFYSILGSMLHGSVALIPISICNMVSFLAIVLIIGFAMKFLKSFVDSVIKVTWYPLIEKIGGMVVGILRGAVATSLVIIFLALVPLSYLQWSIKDKSLYGMFFLRIGPAIYKVVTGGRVDDERIAQDIVSKKEISVKINKNTKNSPEWQKVINAK